MTRIAVIIGSTRPGRRAGAVARWVDEVAGGHAAVTAGEATVEVVDLADYGLPLLDEPVPAVFGEYRNAHTERWAATIGSFDGFVFVTPEYKAAITWRSPSAPASSSRPAVLRPTTPAPQPVGAGGSRSASRR